MKVNIVILKSAFLKLERADQHIADLEHKISIHQATKPHRFSVYVDDQTNRVCAQIIIERPLPSMLALIIGDAVHNLRTALDHMVWEIIGTCANNPKQDRSLQLPSGDTRVSYEAFCRGIQTSSDWATEALIKLEVFPGGKGMPIYNIKLFDNVDKHKSTPIMVLATSHPPFQIIGPNRRIIMENNKFVGWSDRIEIFQLNAGERLDFQGNLDCPVEVFFQGVVGTLPTPVLPCLRFWRMVVAQTLVDIKEIAKQSN